MLKSLKSLKERTDREIIIGLSLDGLQKTHDQIRKVPGSFEQVWEAYDALRDMAVFP